MRPADPIFAAIEQHRLADAAYEDALAAREESERAGKQADAVLLALLRTKPETLAGCLAALRYIASWTHDNEGALFERWDKPYRSAGAAFLPMIADVIEAATRNTSS
jgi:hypothetical protein